MKLTTLVIVEGSYIQGMEILHQLEISNLLEQLKNN